MQGSRPGAPLLSLILLASGLVASLAGCAAGESRLDAAPPSAQDDPERGNDPAATRESSAASAGAAPKTAPPRTEPATASAGSKDQTAPELRPQAPRRYVVKQGDTLWGIANRFLKRPWQWPELWDANPQIEDPHLIYPGDVLHLDYAGERPRLMVDGDTRRTIQAGLPTVQLSPRVRSEPLERRKAGIPIQSIQQFIVKPRVATLQQLESAPYIVASRDDRLVYGPGARVYVRGIGEDPNTRRYQVSRKGDALEDPVTGELLGYEAIPVAEARLIREGDPATVVLRRNFREALRGDRLLPVREEPPTYTFFPRPPEEDVRGYIISLFDALSQVGQHQITVINLGRRDGIKKGHVLAVYRAGRTVRDPYAPGGTESVKLPEERIGILMVFQPFEKVSYALVMEATRAIRVDDAIRHP